MQCLNCWNLQDEPLCDDSHVEKKTRENLYKMRFYKSDIYKNQYSGFTSINSSASISSEVEKPIDEEEMRKNKEYWAAVKYAQSQLYDYYGSGAQLYPAMYSMLDEMKNWTPERILQEARKNGLI